MNTARPRLGLLARGTARFGQGRLFSTALLAAMLAVGCGDDGTDEGTTVVPGAVLPGATGGLGGAAPLTPGATAGGGLTPTTPVGPTTPVRPVTPTTPTGPTTPTTPTTGGADTPWCKVKAILDNKCVACHTTPSVGGAPFPLEKYTDLTAASTKVAGKKVFDRVGVRINAAKTSAENSAQTVMPPGAPLPAADQAVIDSWIAAGAPQGENATCAGTPGAATGGGGQQNIAWPPAECDQVYKITSHAPSSQTTGYSVPPGQESHPQISIPAPWGSEKVQAIAWKTITDKKSVLHHWILNGGGAFLTGWAPGEDGIKMMAPDVGMNMPTGTLRLDMHYNSLQVRETIVDASGVEVCVVKGAKFRKNAAAVTMGLVGIPIIPGNSTNFETKGTCTVGGSTPITLLSASPHAHTLAVRMKFVLQRTTGETLVMHDQPFMFGEQKSFKLDPPVVVNPGDVITTSCFYNNKTSATVTFGENTGNEMCFNFALYYPAGMLSCGGGAGALGGLGGLFGSGGLAP